MKWRDSKLFVYGYLPFRFLFLCAANVFIGIAAAFIFLTWFQPWQVKEIWNRTR